MALSREEKVARVAQYTEQLKESRALILVDYQGLNVEETDKIRRSMRPIAGEFQVIKNRLLALALDEHGMTLPDEWLTGPTAVSFCTGELPPVAKALVEARDETDKLALKGGWMNESILSAAQVERIAELPSREVLLAQVLGSIHGPGRQVAGAIAGGLRQVLNVLQAYVDKLEEGGAGAEMESAAEPA